jgi:hypothetical protein
MGHERARIFYGPCLIDRKMASRMRMYQCDQEKVNFLHFFYFLAFASSS